MRKFFIVLLCAVILSAPALALANSGPVYIHGTPGFEMTVQKNSGISVLHEYLTIDINNDDVALYTAEYRMKNSGESSDVSMAFPLIAQPRNLFDQLPVITCDSRSLDYAIYFGNKVGASYSSPPEYSDIGEASFEELLTLLDLDLGEKATAYFAGLSGHVYSLNLSQFQGSFEVLSEVLQGSERTLILGGAIHQLSYTVGEKVKFSTSVYDGTVAYRGPDTYTFFLSGEKLDIAASIEPYGEGSEDRDIITAPYDAHSQSALTYLTGVFEKQFFGEDSALNEALSSLYLEALHETALVDNLLLVEDEISWLNSTERLAFLVYTVPFEAGQERNVSVQYSALGTSDYTMNEAQYHYSYISSPAKSWDSFGGLDITLKLPQHAPHVLSSTVDFEAEAQQDAGQTPLKLTASLDALPEENISITISSSKTLTEKVNYYATIFYGAIIAFIAFVIIIIALIVFVVIKVRRRKAAKAA
jgi:hypothetical protein